MASLERFFFDPVRFRGLYVIRAALGLIALYYYARLCPHVQALFGPTGVNGYETSRRWPTFPMLVTENFEHFDLLGHISSPALVTTLYVALLISAALFALGLATRISGALLLALHLVFGSHQPTLTWDWVKLYAPFLLYVVLAPSGAEWSLDSLWTARRGLAVASPTFAAWPLRLLQIHVVAMYTTAGWPRLIHEAWLQGQTVMYAVADTRFGRWDVGSHDYRWLLALGTYFAFVLEPAATVLLPLRLTRRWCALALIGMHMSIEILSDVGMWQFVMSTAVLAFLPDRWFAWIPGLGEPQPGANITG